MTPLEELEEIIRNHTATITFNRNGPDICVVVNPDSRDDLWGIGRTLEEAISDFLRVFKTRRTAVAVRELLK